MHVVCGDINYMINIIKDYNYETDHFKLGAA